MALFGRRTDTAPPSEPVAVFGPGRRLRSARSPAEAVGDLSLLISRLAPAPYAAMPVLHPARISWRVDPNVSPWAYCFSYGTDDLFVLVVMPAGFGSQLGLFALGADYADLNTPLAGQWKQVDGSLTSTGSFDPGSLALWPPMLPDRYLESLVIEAGFDASPVNVAAAAEQVRRLLVVKAQQFISMRDAQFAEAFAAQHQQVGDTATCNRVLDDLARWNLGVIPYIQDLPGRIRGILLQRDPRGGLTAELWTQLTRQDAAPARTSDATASDTTDSTIPRCRNRHCTNFGGAIIGRQCPVCFHYLQGNDRG